MLPSPNILPRTYQDLSAIMKENGMQYEEIHACCNGHVVYYNQHEFATECPECHISRYQTDQVTKRCLARLFVILPLFHVCNECLGEKT